MNHTEKNENNKNMIRSLIEEVDTYREAIKNAKEALADAERELDEALEVAYDEQQEEGGTPWD